MSGEVSRNADAVTFRSSSPFLDDLFGGIDRHRALRTSLGVEVSS